MNKSDGGYFVKYLKYLLPIELKLNIAKECDGGGGRTDHQACEAGDKRPALLGSVMEKVGIVCAD